jgi:2-dehydro-3-deoxyphosphogluconate aldolase/(4S)-4-hydroxy-2-oxoglutarate aldolase
MNIRDVLSLGAVMPELLLSDVTQAVPTARALCAGGLRAMEISLRGPEAAACIEAVRKGVPDAIVGAGSLTRAVDFAAADRAGALFGSTPGLTADLAAASRGARFPLIPGVMTPTEVIAARNAGFTVQKLYSFHPAGVGALLYLLQTTFPDLAFVPSGPLTADVAIGYLSRPNVPCLAGSWEALQGFIGRGDWPGVEAFARDAAVHLKAE